MKFFTTTVAIYIFLIAAVFNGRASDTHHPPSEEKIALYKSLSEEGNAEAQHTLALCYFLGKGVEKNHQHAAFWSEKAAIQGHANAQYFLGSCYEYGVGVDKDLSKAEMWYQESSGSAADSLKLFFKEEFSILFLSLIIIPVLHTLGTIVHEWGHTLAEVALFSALEMPTISIGTRNPTQDNESQLLFSVGNMNFYKNFFMGGGSMQPNSIHDQLDLFLNEKEVLCLGAGGIAGAIFLYNILMAIIGYCSYCDDTTAGEIFDTTIRRAFSPFESITQTKNLSFQQKRFFLFLAFAVSTDLITELVCGILPLSFSGNADGLRIWRDRMNVNNQTLGLMKVATFAMWASCIALVVKNYSKACNILFEEKYTLQSLLLQQQKELFEN